MLKRHHLTFNCLFQSLFPLHLSPIFIHCLDLSWFLFHCPSPPPHFPPACSNLIATIFSVCSMMAMLLRLPHCSQYELLICQAVERYSGGRLWHRPDTSLWGGDGNPARRGQRPCSLDILTRHRSFFWTGELYKPNGWTRNVTLLCWPLRLNMNV